MCVCVCVCVCVFVCLCVCVCVCVIHACFHVHPLMVAGVCSTKTDNDSVVFMFQVTVHI